VKQSYRLFILLVLNAFFNEFCLAQTWSPLREASVGGRITSLSVSPWDPQRVLVGGDMLGIGLSLDRGNSWTRPTTLQSYEIADFTWHPTNPNIVWAGTMGGPIVSQDAGVTWSAARTNMPAISSSQYSAPIEKILFDPNNSSTLYAFGGNSRRFNSQTGGAWGTVWKSTNDGQSWTTVGTLPHPTQSRANIVAATFAPGSSSIIYSAVAGEGFYKSTDAGVTWSPSNTGLPSAAIERVVVDPRSDSSFASTIVVSLSRSGTTPGGVYISNDYGQSWSSASSNLATSFFGTPSSYQGLAISRPALGNTSTPPVLTTSDTTDGSNRVYQSQDWGNTWTLINNSKIRTAYPSDLSGKVIAMDPYNPASVYIGTSDYLVRTTTAGTTNQWSDVSSQESGTNTNLWQGRGYSGLVATNAAFNPFNPQHVVVQGFDAARVIQSFDGMQTWQRSATSPSPYNGGRDLTFASASTMYATFGQSNFQGIGKSSDGGQTWITISGSGVGLPAIGTGTESGGIYASNTNAVWAIVNRTLYQSADGGANWTSQAAQVSGNAYWIAAHPSVASTFYVSTSSLIYKTTDGINYTALPSGGVPVNGGKLEVDAQGSLYVAAGNIGGGNSSNGLWKFTDTTGWSQLKSDRYIADVSVNPFDLSMIAIVTDDLPYHDIIRSTGVWLSQDSGVTWSPLNEGLPMLRGATIEFNPHVNGQLIVGTEGGGFYIMTIPEPSSLFIGIGIVCIGLLFHMKRCIAC